MRPATSEYGEGRPLIILHGLFGSRDNWHTVATRLADIRRVITVDLPNHGESPHTTRFDYDSMAAAVAETLDGLSIRDCDLMGHSLGGKAAMRFAQHHAERLGALIVVDIAPVDYPHHSHANIIEALRSVDPTTVSSRRDADEQMARSIGSRAIRAFLLKNLVKANDEYAWRLNIDAIESNYTAIRSFPSDRIRYEGPCLFLRGDRSDYVGEREKTVIEAMFPRADVRTIRGAGHWLHAEKQDEFVREVRDFLQNS